jgi:hypothetical protein
MGSTVLTPEPLTPVAIVAQIIKRTQEDTITWERIEASAVPPTGIRGDLVAAYRGAHAKTGMALLLTTYLDPLDIARPFRTIGDSRKYLDTEFRAPEDRRIPVLDLISDGVQVERIMGLQVLNDLESIVRFQTTDPSVKKFVAGIFE